MKCSNDCWRQCHASIQEFGLLFIQSNFSRSTSKISADDTVHVAAHKKEMDEETARKRIIIGRTSKQNGKDGNTQRGGGERQDQ